MSLLNKKCHIFILKSNSFLRKAEELLFTLFYIKEHVFRVKVNDNFILVPGQIILKAETELDIFTGTKN